MKKKINLFGKNDLNMSEPLISIKKPDGTFVKVTMAEFLAIKKQKITPSVQSVPAAASQTSGVAPTEPKKQNPTMVSAVNKAVLQNPGAKSQKPVELKSVSERQGTNQKSHLIQPPIEKPRPAQYKPFTSADARSPLEEKIAIKSEVPLTSVRREGQVEEVIRRLGFGLPPDLLGRLKSLVLARLKDIKSDSEVHIVLIRPIANGGLGLAQSQAEKIINTISEVHTKYNSYNKHEVKEAQALKGKTGVELMVEPPELPAIAVDVRPKSYNEMGSAHHVSISLPPKSDLIPHNDLVSKLVKESMANEPIFKISSKSAPKQFVSDISAPDMEMGPVEEIRSVTLNDLRKLSSNPEEAAKRVQQKIFNLQEESFIWYLDALSAYHNSPLYLEYIKSICQSLAERKSLANVLMMKNSIKLSEAVAIIEMEKTL
jgi:hypothetical protein